MITAAAYTLLFGASVLAGAINAVAGGGTLITFPSLLAAGVLPVTANATNTVALVPGAITSMYGYRNDMGGSRELLLWTALPNIVGGLIGAKVMLWAGDSVLSMLVPWLILGATVLFLAQEPIARMIKKRSQSARVAQKVNSAEGIQQIVSPTTAGPDARVQVAPMSEAASMSEAALNSQSDELTGSRLALTLAFQFVVAIYGGFFGAGMGILQLAAFGFLGLTNIHQMNGLKNFAAILVNSIAAITFVIAGRVDWPIALAMSAGAIIGGYGGADIALRIGQKRVRQLIIAIGLGITALMFWKQMHGGL
jgi:uncharacterized protein